MMTIYHPPVWERFCEDSALTAAHVAYWLLVITTDSPVIKCDNQENPPVIDDFPS